MDGMGILSVTHTVRSQSLSIGSTLRFAADRCVGPYVCQVGGELQESISCPFSLWYILLLHPTVFFSSNSLIKLLARIS
jgi:hypothetical protein